MTATQIRAALDAHDALVEACAAGSLTFDEFLGAYLGFPENLGSSAGGVREPSADVDRLLGRRIAFHKRVAEVLSGLGSFNSSDQFAPFLSQIGLMRLRTLLREYRQFESKSSARSTRYKQM